MPNNNETPLISQGDVSPSKKQRVETTPTWVWMLVGVMVVLGTVNFVLLGTLYKAYTDEYAFFVNQGINFMYVFMGGMVLYPKQIFTNEINEKTGLRFSQRKLFFLGLLDSFGTLFTALGAVHTPNVIQPLLNQTLIPFTIIFSFIFLGARYHRFALAGATAIVIGASLTVFPCLTGSCKSSSSSNVDANWYSILIYLGSNVPMALSAVYKEIAFKSGEQVNVWYLCQWVSIYQFLISWLFMPITVLPAFGGDGWSNVFDRFYQGLECAFGMNDVCPDAFHAPFPCDERLGTFWLLLGYCIVNFTFNWIGLLLTKHSSATIRSVSYAVILPCTSLAFTLPLMGSLQEKITVYTPVAIVIVLLGFALYQRYSQTIYEYDDDSFDEDDKDSNDIPLLHQQPAFCERTGGLDLVPSTRPRKISRGRSYSHSGLTPASHYRDDDLSIHSNPDLTPPLSTSFP